jgi:FSR family fosmidomycin resistance protein-like MFS transporter
VLYGTVPELTPPERAERAFALFYTGTIGSGAISPVLYGVLGDWVGAHLATAATAIVALAIYPLAFALAPHPGDVREKERSQPDNSQHISSSAST